MSIRDTLQKEFQMKRTDAQITADTNLKNAMMIDEFKNTFNNIRAIQFDIAKLEFQHNDTTPLREKLKLEKGNLKEGENIVFLRFIERELNPDEIL